MNFISLGFLIFFGITCVVYFLLPHRFRWLFLLAASCFFYGYARPEYLLLLAAPTILIWLLALKTSANGDKRKRQRFLWAGLISALAGLILFKYTNFLGEFFYSVGRLFAPGIAYSPFHLIWPVGISFYSFKLISYLMDVYNEKIPAERHLGYLALYAASFPQILAGPIDRAGQFIPQLKAPVTFDFDRIRSGLQQALWGVFKKMVISERLALFVNEVFSKPADHQGLNILIGAYFYAFQIYCDFSGYSDIAVGVSRILGFESMKNFDFPYFSKSMTQFWNRWHISLSTWLRDYLFLPLAYAVMRPIKNPAFMKIRAETWGYVLGMLITMFLGGLWHGPTWTMAAWGLLHGIYLTVGYAAKKIRKKLYKRAGIDQYPRIKNIFAVLFTFHLAAFAWIFFRAETFAGAFQYISLIGFGSTGNGLGYMLFNLILAAIFILLEWVYKHHSQWAFIQRIPPTLKIAGYALFICLIILFSVDTANEFIYFKF